MRQLFYDESFFAEVGLRIRRGQYQIHFRPRQQTALGAARIRHLQQSYLGDALAAEPILVRLLASLTLFDGIWYPTDITSAAQACTQAYRYFEHVAIDWNHIDGRQDRRHLSPLTQQLLPSMTGSTISTRDIDCALERLCNCFYPELGKRSEKYLVDLEGYYLEVLPGALFAHGAHLAPITALPRSALARLQTCEALAVSEIPSAPTANIAMGLALDQAFQSDKRSGGSWLVDRLSQLVNQHSKRDDAADRKSMIDGCFQLAGQVEQADALSALILAWVIDLAESGSIQKEVVRPRTIYKYVSQVARGLHQQFGGLDLGAMTAERFLDLYQSILDSTQSGNRGNCVTALKSWHGFLVEWLDAPPLHASLAPDTGLDIPKANVIWAHEFARIDEWTSAAMLEERLKKQLSLCIYLARHVRLRAKELFHLRLRNIIDYGDGQPMEIEVAPMLRDGKLKSDSARRTQTLSDPEALELLRTWIARRKAEGALADDLLLGDPHHPRRVFQLGRLYVLINQLLKATTGEPRVSLHALSHTWASVHLEQVFLDPCCADINQLELKAKNAGHRCVVTTLFYYFHAFERPIRERLDREMRTMSLTSRTAARWSGIRADALRQRSSYQNKSCQDVYWDAIQRRTPISLQQQAASGINLGPPTPPNSLARSNHIHFNVVLEGLKDLANGLSLEQVELRMDAAPALVQEIAVLASQQVSRLRVKRLHRPDKTGGAGIAEARGVDQFASLGIDVLAIRQAKWSPVVDWIVRHESSEQLDRLIAAWERSFDRGFLALHDEMSAIVLFRCLKDWGIPNHQIALALGVNDVHNITVHEKEAARPVDQAFACTFNIPPLCDWRTTRRDRPSMFLVWSGVPLHPGAKAPSASLSLAGFHGLMLTAAVYRVLLRSADAVVRRVEA